MDLLKELKKLFVFLNKHKKIVLISLIVLFISLTFFAQIKKIIFIIIFIAISSVSKLYHKIFKSTIIIDVVLFLTTITCLVYKNTLLGLIVGVFGSLLADYFAQKLNPFSLVTLSGIVLSIFLSQFLFSFPLILSLILITIIFEIFTCTAYYFLGSSFDKIIVFLISHFISNMIMIFSFAIPLSQMMI